MKCATQKDCGRLVLVLVVALAAFGQPAIASAATCVDADTQPAQITPPRFEAATLCLVNNERTDRGLRALQPQSQLTSAADKHSNEMSRLGYFTHASADGSPFTHPIVASGYLRHARAWLVGQNLAWGSDALGTPQNITTAWMDSPGHRANILNRRFRDTGVGAAWGSPTNSQTINATIVTQDFGSIDHQRRARNGSRSWVGPHDD